MWVLISIIGDTHELFKAGIQVRDIYPELKNYFYREHFNLTWEEFLTTIFGLWVDKHSNTDNTLMAVVGQWENRSLRQIEKVA